MTDEQRTGSGQPPASASATGPAATPVEAQFPYVATHGLQSPAAVPPRLSRQAGRRRPGRRSWLPWGIAAGLVVSISTVTAVVLTGGPSPVLGPRSEAAATQAVQGYLDALARGDTATALGYAAQAPSDPTLLTDRVLAEQRATTPIREIAVGAPLAAGRVPASYLLGTERVSVVFELTLDDGAWRLDRVAAGADLSGFAVPVAVDGALPRTARPELFPGHYELASANPRYTVANGGFAVRHPFEQPVIAGTLELSEAGRAEVIEAAEAHLADCLDRQELAPSGCGFSLAHPEQTPLDESTVAWRARGGADFTDLVLDHAGSATAEMDLIVHGDVRGVDGSRWSARVELTRMRADLTGPVVRVQFG